MSVAPVYASTACLARAFATLPAQLAAYTAGGLDHIELGWAPPLGPLALPGGLGDYRAQWLVHNYFPAPAEPFVLNLAAQHAPTLRRSREFAAAAIRLAAAAGAPFYSVHCGFLAEFGPGTLGHPLRYDEICDYERGYATFVESLRLLLATAAAAGIRLLIEPNVVAPFNLVDGRNLLLMLATPPEFHRLRADVPDPRLGVLLDLGHLRVTAATLGFDRLEFIEAVAPAVGAFHLHDNDGTADQHRPIAPESWTLAVLRQPHFTSLPIVVEAKFERVEALAEHCIWLKNSLNR
jgi:sugar phosphate isomerase/epimerase